METIHRATARTPRPHLFDPPPKGPPPPPEVAVELLPLLERLLLAAQPDPRPRAPQPGRDTRE